MVLLCFFHKIRCISSFLLHKFFVWIELSLLIEAVNHLVQSGDIQSGCSLTNRVLERRLRFGGGKSALVLFKSSDDWETTRDCLEFLTPVGRAVRLSILDMVARACAHALIF